MPVLNRYDLLQRMLNSVDVPVEHLLVIDNGPGEDLFFSDKFVNVTVLAMPANLGVAGSWNLGIKSFPYAQRWFIASNDVVFEPGSLEALSKARRDEITLTADAPHWQAFVLGDEAVGETTALLSRLAIKTRTLRPMQTMSVTISLRLPVTITPQVVGH